MTFPELYKKSLLEAIEKIDLVKVELAISWFRDARDSGRAIFTCGNGGSASTASHWVNDLGKATKKPGKLPIRVMSLRQRLLADCLSQRRRL